MSHKTLISGTSYAIKGGTDLIAGTSYQIGGGRTLVNGTSYKIGFAEPVTITITGVGYDTSYKVASGFGKHGAPYCELYEIVDKEEINLTKSTIAETRKFLENEILHCDMSIFLRTILLSSDQNYNFFRLRKGEKKEEY